MQYWVIEGDGQMDVGAERTVLGFATAATSSTFKRRWVVAANAGRSVTRFVKINVDTFFDKTQNPGFTSNKFWLCRC